MENLQRVSSYRIYYNKQVIIILLGGVAVMVITIIISYFFTKMQAWQWITLFGALGVGAVGTWWEYKRMYQKNIDTIQKSLEELKELE